MFDDYNYTYWNMFTTTGQIGYYLLYKKLHEQNNENDEKDLTE